MRGDRQSATDRQQAKLEVVMDLTPISRQDSHVAERPLTRKRMIVMLVVVAGIIAAVVAYKSITELMRSRTLAQQANVAQLVSTAVIAKQSWAPQIEAVGSLRAVSGTDLSFEVAGIVDQISFTSGDDVEAGKVLVQLRDEDVAAKLRSMEALAQLADLNYQRSVALSKSQNVSQSTIDTNLANLKNAQAQVAEQRAILAKKTIRAPFAGRLGVRAVDQGQYVNAGTPIVTLQQLDPIFVDFFLPQQNLNVVKAGQTLTATIDTYPNLTFTGEISAVNPKVETNNRNVQVRATLQNPDKKLLPGMFATVTINAGTATPQIVLPQAAVVYNAYGDSVYVLDNPSDANPTVRYQFVTLGETRGDMVAAQSGVKEGETVVVSGQVKLRNGTKVKVDNSIPLGTDLAPKPVNP